MPAAGIIGVKRKAETPARACDEETTSLPPTVIIDSQKWFCKVCHVSTTSEVTLNTHFQGKKHKSKEARSVAMGTTYFIGVDSNTADNTALPLQPVQPVDFVGTTKWNCSLCQLSLTSEMLLVSHLQGKKHKAKEAKAQAGVIMASVEEFLPLKSQEMSVASSIETGNATAANADNQWYCKVCGISASSENNLNDHFKGKRHKAKAGLQEQVLVEMSRESTMMQESETGVVKRLKMDQESTEKVSGVEVIRQSSLEADDNPKAEQEGTKLKLMDDLRNPEIMLPTEAKVLEKDGDGSLEFVKYWHCKMCNQGTYDEATIVAHRNGADHVALLKKHGGGLISVMNVQKVEQKSGEPSDEKLTA